MTTKWFRYGIDYEYGIAELWSKERLDDPVQKFEDLANECFGIRKSIGEVKLLEEELLPFEGDVETPKMENDHLQAMGGVDWRVSALHAVFNKPRKKEISEDQRERASYVLAHSGGDVIVFDDREYKIISEFDS